MPLAGKGRMSLRRVAIVRSRATSLYYRHTCLFVYECKSY